MPLRLVAQTFVPEKAAPGPLVGVPQAHEVVPHEAGGVALGADAGGPKVGPGLLGAGQGGPGRRLGAGDEAG